MGNYDDLIDLPYPFRPSALSDNQRAAQFLSFSALTGLDAALMEEARLTDKKIELDDTRAAMLDEQIRITSANISDCPAAEIMYFVPDERKSGGKYVTVFGEIRRIDEDGRVLIFTDGTVIPFGDILYMRSIIDKP